MRALLVCLLVSLSCGTAIRAQEPSPAGSVQSVAGAGVPKGYVVGTESVSPNGRFAILYPVRGNEGADLPPNFLVCLGPYAVLSRIGDDHGRAEGDRGEPLAKWIGNSAVAIWIARKWGIEDLAIYEIERDEIKRVQAIWQEVRKLFDRDFRERFLTKYPDEKGSGIVFVSEGEGKPSLEFKGRKIVLNLFADNKPNLSYGPHWTARLHAVWDVDKAKFDKADFHPGEIELREDQ